MAHKLSSLIREGLNKANPTRNSYIHIDDKGEVYACPLGMAALALDTGMSPEELSCVDIEWLISRNLDMPANIDLPMPSLPDQLVSLLAPADYDTFPLFSSIIVLTDVVRWTPDQIIEWLESEGY